MVGIIKSFWRDTCLMSFFLKRKATPDLHAQLEEERRLRAEAEEALKKANDAEEALKKANDALIGMVAQVTSKQACFHLTVRILNAFRRRGYRKFVYHVAGLNQTYATTEEKNNSIFYDDDDLMVIVAFETSASATSFFNALNPLNEMADDIVVQMVSLARVPDEELDLARIIYQQDYDKDDFQSKEGSRESVVSSSQAPMLKISDAIAMYQRLEPAQCINGPGFENCHIKDKARCRGKEAGDPNNHLGLTPSLHAMFDGHNGGVPTLTIEYGRVEDGTFTCEVEGHNQNRYKVWVTIKFMTPEAREGFQSTFKEGTIRVDDLTYQTPVFVRDPAKFEEFLDWKVGETKKKWLIGSVQNW